MFEEGGLDLDLVLPEFQKQAQEYVCAICSGLCYKPRIICPKSHMFCESCIYRLLKCSSQKDKCPSCRSKFSTKDIKQPIRPLVNILDLIRVKCPNKDWCWKELQYDELDRHLKECKKPEEKCKGCLRVMHPDMLEDHVQNCVQFLRLEVKRLENRIAGHAALCWTPTTPCPECNVNEVYKMKVGTQTICLPCEEKVPEAERDNIQNKVKDFFNRIKESETSTKLKNFFRF
ncbi:Oidioi.mRNA.OKI2018_I69.chr1.g3820.t1.cds [Oikopleura dioica]|uniref:Oidioi.mRNA.OKI2018_I69.chr1.g3820.t1.cds n=1 Tax=Oikopleura dioica TaxID=34765 RepID=A0ABN7SV87_OIKDI|nr:Oidioi.mRNA.OKI2018_I69.chr1.g3820.t1.cds [Oikopleura dioica]